MPFHPTVEQQMLDWALGGSSPTRPASRFISFATGTPNESGASDGPFSPRVTCTFAAAGTAPRSASNANAMANATATAVGTVRGWNLWDAPTGGNRLAYGTATSLIGCASADNVSIAAGALRILLS